MVMKLYRYTNFIKESTIQSKEDIDSICRKYSITNYTINEDGSIDVDGDLNLFNSGLNELPLKFRNVKGHFDCSNNELISLKGAPISVDGSFFCYKNKLTSLDGAPESIGGDFICFDNRLTSLEGSPRYVGGEFNCSNNQLTSLEGIPKSIGSLFFQNNKLRDVKGIDGWRGSHIYTSDNPVYEIFKLFPKGRHDEVVEYLNEFGVIRDDGKVVVLQALEQVFVEMELEVPEIENIKGYEII